MKTLWQDVVYGLPCTAQEARLHGGGSSIAGARHRREHRHLQPHQHHLASSASFSGSRPDGDDLVGFLLTPRDQLNGVMAVNYKRVPGEGPVLRGDGSHSQQCL